MLPQNVTVRVQKHIAELWYANAQSIFDGVHPSLRHMKSASVAKQPGGSSQRELSQGKRGVDGVAMNVTNEHHIVLLAHCCQRAQAKKLDQVVVLKRCICDTAPCAEPNEKFVLGALYPLQMSFGCASQNHAAKL